MESMEPALPQLVAPPELAHETGPGGRPLRFFCPVPGCQRSFSAFWRWVFSFPEAIGGSLALPPSLPLPPPISSTPRFKKNEHPRLTARLPPLGPRARRRLARRLVARVIVAEGGRGAGRGSARARPKGAGEFPPSSGAAAAAARRATQGRKRRSLPRACAPSPFRRRSRRPNHYYRPFARPRPLGAASGRPAAATGGSLPRRAVRRARAIGRRD